MALRAAVVFVVLVAASCGATGGSRGGAGPCVTEDFQCEKAVQHATDRLGGIHWPVTATHWRYGLCGPGIPCDVVGAGEFGWVIFEFTVGDPVMIHVHSVRQADGEGFVLVADAPQAPPAWVLETLDDPPP